MIKIEMICIFGVFAAFVLLEAALTHLLRKPHQTRDDARVEIIGSFTLLLATQPLFMFLAYSLMRFAVPQA